MTAPDARIKTSKISPSPRSYKKISQLANSDIFTATTLLVVLGTSIATQLAGLSLALGAFLAGLLIAETEFALQVRLCVRVRVHRAFSPGWSGVSFRTMREPVAASLARTGAAENRPAKRHSNPTARSSPTSCRSRAC
jgi:hypothetical protein